MWDREHHAWARLAADEFDFRKNPKEVDEIGAYAARFLGEALDEIERLSRYIQDEWAKEGITPNPSFPLAMGLWEVKNPSPS